MSGRILQLLVKLAVVTALLWVGRRALIRWVNGPEARPSPAPWPPLDSQDRGTTVGPAEPAAGTATAGPADLAAGTATAGPDGASSRDRDRRPRGPRSRGDYGGTDALKQGDAGPGLGQR